MFQAKLRDKCSILEDQKSIEIPSRLIILFWLSYCLIREQKKLTINKQPLFILHKPNGNIRVLDSLHLPIKNTKTSFSISGRMG